MTAEILKLSDFRVDDIADGETDLITVVDVATRDLREILMFWGSDRARERAEECANMLRHAITQHTAG